MHHFFGYYGICPWDPTGRYMLSLETSFDDRMPGPDDVATVGMIDLRDANRFIPLAETRAWNVQQGALEQWLPDGRHILFNDRQGDRFVSVVLDVQSGERRVLPAAVSDVSRDGKLALSVNYARLTRLRPVIGYPGVEDPTAGVLQPEDDGAWSMDVESGAVRLLLSTADVVRSYRGETDLSGKEMYLSHTLLNPSGTRFLFLARYPQGPEHFDTAMFTAAADGGNLRLAVDFGRGVSHFWWIDDSTILVTMDLHGKGSGSSLVRFTDGKADFTEIGAGILNRDGHPSLSPDGRFLVTDTYPDGRMLEHVYVFDLRTGKSAEIAKFRHPAKLMGPLRCDLHPRWNRDGAAVSVDARDARTRQVYVIPLKPAATAGQGGQ